MVEIVLVLGMQVLVVKVIEELHEDLQDNDVRGIVGIVEYGLQDIASEIFEIVVNFVAHFYYLLVQGVVSRGISILVGDIVE